jgi:uncharacterized protein (DUF924 family)
LNTESIEQIASFWLGPSLNGPETAAARRDWWYQGGTVVDDEIRARFGTLVDQACAGGLADWQASAQGSLALILLLDQFTRNLFRHTPQAYAGDPRAFEVVKQAIELKHDQQLHPVAKIWLYHPFHHAESIAEQGAGMALLGGVLQTAPIEWHPYVERSISGWGRHRNIVARFGRFPHRNSVLDRASTDEEREFMNDGAEAFGQGTQATSG